MAKWIKALRCEDGQAIVELAFVLPLVLLFLFGIIDFGLALNNSSADTNMANLAARTASVLVSTTPTCQGNSESTLFDWVRCEAAAIGAPTPTSVCVNDIAGATPTNTYTQGDPIKVVVTSSFSWLKLLTGQISNLQSSISGSATMRLETQPTGTSMATFLGSTCTT